MMLKSATNLVLKCIFRHYLPTTARSPAEEETERIHAVNFLPISEPQLAEIEEETSADSVLQCLMQVILQGWSDPQNYCER